MGPWVVQGIQGVHVRGPLLLLRAHTQGPCNYPEFIAATELFGIQGLCFLVEGLGFRGQRVYRAWGLSGFGRKVRSLNWSHRVLGS